MKVNARLPILIFGLLLLPCEAAAQGEAPDLNLGRIRVINRSVDAYTTEQNLFVVPYNFSFKVAYKLQDNSRYEPFNTRATAELKAQYTFGRLGTAEDWYVIWRKSDKKENMNPTATYKKESSFNSSETLPVDELMRRYVIWLHGESGKSGDTDSHAFTLIRRPSRGDALFLHTVIENEVAKANYQLLADNLREFADASAAQQQLQEGMARLWHNAKLFIEHYDLYADPQGAWADAIAWALSKRFPLIAELWMLIEYKTFAENLINDVNSSVSTAINMSTLAKGMKVAHDYLLSAACNDPLAATAIARSALKAYGYDRSLEAAATVSQLDDAIEVLDGYKACVQEARSRFANEVGKWRDISPTLSDHQKVQRFGENLFEHHERYITLHQVTLASLGGVLSPICGDGKCFAGETCLSCERDCCRPYDACFAPSDQPTNSVAIDYRDDRIETRLYLRDDDFRDLVSRPVPRLEFVWNLELVGRAFATADPDQGGITVALNGTPVCEFLPHQRFPADRFARANACTVTSAQLRYTNFSVNAPFRMGWNEITLTTNSHWTANGLRVGLDVAHDCDRSAWDNNWGTRLNPADDTGEAMISQRITVK
jgi:hypothetical protein